MTRFKGRRGKSTVIFGCILICLFLPLAIGIASEGGEPGAAGHAEEHDGKLKDLLARGINFALLVIILVVVIRKTSIKDFFASRKEEIKQKMEELSRDKEAAEKRYKELEQERTARSERGPGAYRQTASASAMLRPGQPSFW